MVCPLLLSHFPCEFCLLSLHEFANAWINPEHDSMSPYTHLLQITVVEEGDLIAKRTRSQLPLQDVPIESIEGIPFLQKLKLLICDVSVQLKKD